jgi:hypothetical protein
VGPPESEGAVASSKQGRVVIDFVMKWMFIGTAIKVPMSRTRRRFWRVGSAFLRVVCLEWGRTLTKNIVELGLWFNDRIGYSARVATYSV